MCAKKTYKIVIDERFYMMYYIKVNKNLTEE